MMRDLAFADHLLVYGSITLCAAMAVWIVALWRDATLLNSMAFRVVPFAAGIAAFAVAFYAERFH
jgi:hypothetical protein